MWSEMPQKILEEKVSIFSLSWSRNCFHNQSSSFKNITHHFLIRWRKFCKKKFDFLFCPKILNLAWSIRHPFVKIKIYSTKITRNLIEFFRVVRIFVLELPVLGLSWKTLSRSCPGQFFSFAKPPQKILNPSNFLLQTKNSRTLPGQKISLEKSFISYKRTSGFFLWPGHFQDGQLQDKKPRRPIFSYQPKELKIGNSRVGKNPRFCQPVVVFGQMWPFFSLIVELPPKNKILQTSTKKTIKFFFIFSSTCQWKWAKMFT